MLAYRMRICLLWTFIAFASASGSIWLVSLVIAKENKPYASRNGSPSNWPNGTAVCTYVSVRSYIVQLHKKMNVPVLLFVLVSILPPSTTVLQYEPVGNYFPSCLDIVDVHPYPYSILKPIGEHQGYSVYTIQVTFSKAITWYTRSKLSSFILAPLLTANNQEVPAKFIKSWRGSERMYVLLFYVNHTELSTP
jgi:hypothetical protein